MSRASALLAVLALAAARPTTARADDGAVSLAALIEAARQHHPTLARQPLLARSLALQERLIDQAYLPHAQLAGQATWQSDVTSIAIPIPGVTVTPPPNDQYKVTLEIQQSIWDGGRARSQRHVAAGRAAIAEQQVNLEWFQVRQRILELYFAGVVQQQLAAQAATLDRRLGEVVAKVQVAQQHGVATPRDVLLAQARQLEAQQALADAQAQLASVRRALIDLTGTTIAADAALTAPPIACDPAAPTAPAALHRPELDALTAQAGLLTAQDEVDRAADRPRLGAFATLGYGRPGLNFLDPTFQPYVIGGVQLTVPLTHLYAGTRAKTRQQLEVQRALLDRQRDAVLTQVEVQLDAQRAEIGRLDATLALDEQLAQVRVQVRGETETQLRLGTATMTDLITDLSQEDLAQSKLVVHRAQRSLACHQLAFIQGEL
ncbi:MAG: TolC family protein [Kofleriaceae bacterium]